MTKSTSEQAAARRVCAAKELTLWDARIKKALLQYYKGCGFSSIVAQIAVCVS